MHANTRVCMHAHTPLVCMYTHARACVHALSQKKSYFMQRHPTVGSCGRRNQAHLVRTQILKVLPLKPGVGQYIAIHATLTARDFFLAYFYTSGPFTCIFSKTSPEIFPVLAVANTWFLCKPAE